MSEDEDKKNISDNESKIDENQSEVENSSTDDSTEQKTEQISDNNQNLQPDNEPSASEKEITPENKSLDVENTAQITSESESDENKKKEHEVIHKKDGRLHIYVRQDKYKGELKSKNWVGRLYHDGKQKISSSGTPNLEEAIPILEKWFDDVVSGKEKEKEVQAQSVTTEQTSIQSDNSNQIENIQATNQSTTTTETKNDTTNLNQVDDEGAENKKSKFAFLDNLKNIKFKKPDFIKNSSVSKSSFSVFKSSFFSSNIRFSFNEASNVILFSLSKSESIVFKLFLWIFDIVRDIDPIYDDGASSRTPVWKRIKKLGWKLFHLTLRKFTTFPNIGIPWISKSISSPIAKPSRAANLSSRDISAGWSPSSL